MLNQLPTELGLNTLSYLGVRDLRNVQLVSRSWRSLFVENEDSIYRHAASVHALTPSPDISLGEAKDVSPPCSMHGVNSWKGLIQRRFETEYRWQGHWNPGIKELNSAGSAVHRIKVDQEAGYIITTSSQRGLIVTDIVSNEVLWSLSQDYVTEYAHCEYDNGFIIFNNEGNGKDVWRRSCDCIGTQRPTESLPSVNQLRASEEAGQRYPSTTHRGHFEPWAYLEMPEEGRAFRMVYPTLLVSGWNRAFLWDVPTARLRATIQDIQMPHVGGPLDTLGRITYVELSDRYGTLLFHVDGWQKPHTRWTLGLLERTKNTRTRPTPKLVPRRLSLKDSSRDASLSPPQFAAHDYFTAAHLSPCGSMLVALLACGTAIIIRDLARVIKGEIALADASVEVDLRDEAESPWWTIGNNIPSPYSIYLAVGDERIGVATKGGIYVITLDKHKHDIIVPGEEMDPGLRQTVFPNISVCRAASFSDNLALKSLSCLQMTAVGLYFTFKLNGTHPHIDEPMQSEVEDRPTSEPANIEGLNDLNDNSGHEAEGDDTPSGDAPEDGDYDFNDDLPEPMGISDSSDSDFDADPWMPRTSVICMNFAPLDDHPTSGYGT